MEFINFFTATILNWQHLLKEDCYKDIIINSMRFLVADNRVLIFAFVIMPNHIHIVWKLKGNITQEDLQRDFLKYTAQKLKLRLIDEKSQLISEFYVGAKDRKYQIWERKALTSRLPTIEIVEQKINYIHLNPIRGKWMLAKEFLEYKYSSAQFYYEGVDEWGFLTHYMVAEVD